MRDSGSGKGEVIYVCEDYMNRNVSFEDIVVLPGLKSLFFMSSPPGPWGGLACETCCVLGEGWLLPAEIWPLRNYCRTCLVFDPEVRGRGKPLLSLYLVSISYTSLVSRPHLN